ncbi:MAG: hypothetical protein A2Y55_02065 [Actinobacteria bacterium RBG_16_68_12]|nr:MAG: hypothetical protein A2Y55_02065 [Actinobacteria bacterium RBG_16_68_12]
MLRGVTSNERYLTRAEHVTVAAVQPPLGRAAATEAALIPICKSTAWWHLAQDERRATFEYLEIFHNRRRRHSALGMLTPFEFEKMHTYPSEVA